MHVWCDYSWILHRANNRAFKLLFKGYFGERFSTRRVYTSKLSKKYFGKKKQKTSRDRIHFVCLFVYCKFHRWFPRFILGKVSALNEPASDRTSIHQFIQLKSKKKDHYPLRNVLNSFFFQRHIYSFNKLKSITWRPSGIQLHTGHELQVGNVLLIMPASVPHVQLESKYFPSNSADSLFGVL